MTQSRPDLPSAFAPPCPSCQDERGQPAFVQHADRQRVIGCSALAASACGSSPSPTRICCLGRTRNPVSRPHIPVCRRRDRGAIAGCRRSVRSRCANLRTTATCRRSSAALVIRVELRVGRPLQRRASVGMSPDAQQVPWGFAELQHYSWVNRDHLCGRHPNSSRCPAPYLGGCGLKPYVPSKLQLVSLVPFPGHVTTRRAWNPVSSPVPSENVHSPIPVC